MTNTAHLLNPPAASGGFPKMSVFDLSEATDLLAALRTSAHTSSCLANHMGREGFEEFADEIVADIDARLAAIGAEICRRSFAIMKADADLIALAVRFEAIFNSSHGGFHG